MEPDTLTVSVSGSTYLTGKTEMPRTIKPVLSKDQAMRLRRLIAIYSQALINDSWKGGGDPSEIPLIEEELEEAGNNLVTYIRGLTKSKKRKKQNTKPIKLPSGKLLHWNNS